MTNQLGVVVTSYNQGTMVEEAVASLLRQTQIPDKVVVVDDGSSQPESLRVLRRLERRWLTILRQPNEGVSAARNAGIKYLGTDLVAVLDGDDRFRSRFLQTVRQEFGASDVMVASSWLEMFGATSGLIRPTGGSAVDFLARNCCPAPAIFKYSGWQAAGGYAEDMRRGFEDWDFFLRILTLGGRVAIVPEALIEYRTQPNSGNLQSMTRRLDLYSELVSRHRDLFAKNMQAVLVAQEAISIERLARWEKLVLAHPHIDPGEATFGDGGMASLVRIATSRSS